MPVLGRDLLIQLLIPPLGLVARDNRDDLVVLSRPFVPGPERLAHDIELVADFLRGGKSGPSLAGASKRLNPDWIYAYMTNIKAFKPVRDMPDFASALNKKDLASVAAYVATFE